MTVTAEPRTGGQPAPARRGRWRDWCLSTPVLVIVGAASLAYVIRWTVLTYLTAPRQFLDLSVYRLGVQAWWHGQNMYGVLPPDSQGNHLPFLYPPFAAALFTPFALLSWHQVIGGMLLLSLLSLLVTIYLTAMRIWPDGGVRGTILVTAVTLPLSLKAEPVWDTIWYGQINLVLMALVALDCLTPHPKWPRGLLIGIAAAVKLTPAVFILFFLLRKDFRTSVTIVISGAVATGIGFLTSWQGSMSYWFGSNSALHGVSGTGFIGNQSIDGALGRWGLPHHTQKELWLAAVAVVGVASILAIIKAHRRDNAPLAMVITAMFGLVASPTSWGHYWIYAVPAIMVMVAVAASWPQLVPVTVTNSARPVVMVRACTLVSVAANRYSFQAKTQVRIAVTASPGRASGMMTLVSTVQVLAPSTMAASSSSFGIPSMVVRSVQMAKGRLKTQ